MNELTKYEGDIIYAVQDLLDIPHGDASGIVECNNFAVMQGFAGGVSAADVAKKIIS